MASAHGYALALPVYDRRVVPSFAFAFEEATLLLYLLHYIGGG